MPIIDAEHMTQLLAPGDAAGASNADKAPVYSWCSWQPQYGLIIGLIVLFLIGLIGRLVAAKPTAASLSGKG